MRHLVPPRTPTPPPAAHWRTGALRRGTLCALAILAMAAVCSFMLFVLIAELVEASRPVLVHFPD